MARMEMVVSWKNEATFLTFIASVLEKLAKISIMVYFLL